jgi:hypothetical protein
MAKAVLQRKRLVSRALEAAWLAPVILLVAGPLAMPTIKRMSAFFSVTKKIKVVAKTMPDLSRWLLWGGDAGRSWANRIIKMVESRQKGPMSEYVRVIEDEEEGIGLLKALAILSGQ